MQIQNLNSPRKSAHRENKGYLRSTSRKIFKEKEILKLRYIKKKKRCRSVATYLEAHIKEKRNVQRWGRNCG